MKAANGKRIASCVPYGYVKNPEDKDQWLIDLPAAEVVRKIFLLCIAGRGPLQVAKDLEAEKILTPTAYYNSIGRPTSNPASGYPYRWSSKTIEHVLANRQYTGCTVNFMTTTVSYKVHKTVYKPEEEWQIIPNAQEAIIDENTWLRIQELLQNKRRPTATGRKSLFSGLVFCPDCGAKLHFCAAKSLRRDQEFFRCSNYKSGRGECRIHFIRDVVLQKIVTEAVSDLADFVRCYEPVFLYMLAKKDALTRKRELQTAKAELEHSRKRIGEIDRIISQMYEDNMTGEISDERFSRMSQTYEAEQRNLEKVVAECEERLRYADKETVDLRMLL